MNRFFLVVFILFLYSNVATAQDKSLSKAYKQQVIDQLSQLMNDFYVFPEVASSTEEHLRAQLKQGHFDAITEEEAFAEALTKSVQSINKDKHMKIKLKPPYIAPKNSRERMIEEKLDEFQKARVWNAGFHAVKVLEGNIGYLDLRSFARPDRGNPMADAYMKLIANTDAVIVDLRKNTGGSPAMVQYLCSYFFDKKLHLNSLYFRERDRSETEEYWTLDKVGGSKMPDVPLFVLTSNRTFSGAEEFSYNMQTQKRATLIGQTTGGGANPGTYMNLSDQLIVFIPTGRAINPITKTNWEGVGVKPEIETKVEETFEKAHALAKEAAEEYRTEIKKKHTALYLDLYAQLDEYTEGKSEEAILSKLRACRDEKLLDEDGINMLGYKYLMEKRKKKIARAIFRANTIFYPNSANVYDSYAESLMEIGDLKASLENYQKAVDIATKTGDGNASYFKGNLQKLKDRLNTEK